MQAVLDTNVLLRHLTATPPEQGRQATAFLARAEKLFLSDLVVAELVYALESEHRVERGRVAELVRAAIAFPSVIVLDQKLLLRALELYEQESLDFVSAHLAASAERSGIGAVASFHLRFEPLATVERIEPS